jgi:hypothetical protein
MPLYQLSIPPGTGPTHVPFVYFSNGLGGDQRFSVVVTHRRLDPLETQRVCERIVRHHGSTAPLGRRCTGDVAPGFADGDYSTVNLEFMRYLTVWGAGDLPEACVCLDTLCDVAPWPVSERDMVGCRVPLVAADIGPGGMASTVPGASGRADRARTLRFQTSTHGSVVVRVATFLDPNIRNGVSILPSRVSVDDAWGAAVRAVHPKKLLARHLARPPAPLPRGAATCAGVNEDTYYEPQTGHFVGDPTPRTMMVPRGGKGRAYRVDVGADGKDGTADED